MFQPVIEMEKILKEELEIYEQIYALEEQKSEAIMERDGKRLESISLNQERFLKLVERCEKRREEQIEHYRRSNNLDDLIMPATLKNVVHSMDEDSAHHLLRIGLDLKNLLVKFSKLQENNEKLIHDNLEFYDILISGLRNSNAMESGYDQDGCGDEKVKGPILFNQTA